MGRADISLRHIARRWGPDLARGLIVQEPPVEVTGWLDSQLTATERRLDKALSLRVAGKERALHIEFEVDPDARLPARVFEYQAMLFLGLRASSGSAPRKRVAPIKSVVIVLRGPKEPTDSSRRHRIGWPEDRFSGARFHIEPVYQRTVSELRDRGSLVWLVFTPLARDATAEHMRAVFAEIRAAVPRPEDRVDIYITMGALADLKPWGYSLRQEMGNMLQLTEDAVFRESVILQEAFAEGVEKGIEKGIEKSIERRLMRLFAERSGRPLTPAEQEDLAQRARDTTPEKRLDLVELPDDALLAWLTGK